MRCPLASHIAGTAGNDNSANAPGNSTVKSYSNFKCDNSQHGDDIAVVLVVVAVAKRSCKLYENSALQIITNSKMKKKKNNYNKFN